MPRNPEELVIDFNSLTAGEIATVRAVAAEGGIEPNLWHLVDMSNPPVPVLAGLIFVTMRRTEPRITAKRCVRLALAAVEANNGR